jgi:hypothetical protein
MAGAAGAQNVVTKGGVITLFEIAAEGNVVTS